MENHKAQDSHRNKAKKDKINLKKKGVTSPDLSKMYSVKCYIENLMGRKFSHVAYNSTLQVLRSNMSANYNKYSYGEIKEPV